MANLLSESICSHKCQPDGDEGMAVQASTMATEWWNQGRITLPSNPFLDSEKKVSVREDLFLVDMNGCKMFGK